MMLSPGAKIVPGGRMKQLFGAVVWNCSKNNNEGLHHRYDIIIMKFADKVMMMMMIMMT